MSRNNNWRNIGSGIMHLKFNRKVCLQQVQQGGHCHLEQPAYAQSWKTKALYDLPGF
jgi:hypothetical protein